MQQKDENDMESGRRIVVWEKRWREKSTFIYAFEILMEFQGVFTMQCAVQHIARVACIDLFFLFVLSSRVRNVYVSVSLGADVVFDRMEIELRISIRLWDDRWVDSVCTAEE